MFKATKEIAAAFDALDIKYAVSEDENRSFVKARFSGNNVHGVDCYFVSTDDENDVAFRIFSFAKVPEEKRDVMYALVNVLNGEYRYFAFSLEEDGSISAAYDFPAKCVNVGDIAVEIFARAMDVLDEAYPMVMREIWHHHC